MKNKKVFILGLIFVLLFSSFSFAEKSGGEDVYVIPIKGEINGATKNFVVGQIKKINEKDNVAAVIFEIDTYGGLIDKAIDIKDAVVDMNIPTISYVNNKAESAGVLMTIASENVVMSPNATIGSAETIPNTEKIMSMWRAVLRDTAQQHGRDEKIVEGMAEKDIEIEGLSEKGKLINLTSQEAEKHKISDYTVTGYDDILEKFDLSGANLIKIEESFQVKLAKYISSPYISSTLLSIAFIGMVVEIFTPGFGIGGTISIIGFGLYFGGNILAGHSQWTSLVLFITGFLLLIVEGIVPGFGLPGISGIILVVVGIVMAMDSIGLAITSISVALIVTTIITTILIKLGFKSTFLDKIILKNKDEELVSSVNKESLVGKMATTVTDLRPSGFITFEDDRLDALSDEGFIEKDTKVEVVRQEGNRIFVRRM